MTITYHKDLIQGTDAWYAARTGLITSSEVKLLLTPTLRQANNDKSRAQIWELAAQRISNYVEPSYQSEAMLRGHEDEIAARNVYRAHYGEVEECGFVTNNSFGFTMGCSPDGLIGSDGILECKSRMQKYQVQTIVENWREATVPDDFILQIQHSMMVTGRSWCDLVSYSNGLPMFRETVPRNDEMCDAILEACTAAEEKIAAVIADYHEAVEKRGYPPTERRIDLEIFQ